MHPKSRGSEKIVHIHGHPVKITKKRMKSLRLRLIPPGGEIRVSAPLWYSDARITEFILSRWDWVEKQQKTISGSHPLVSQRYRLGDQILFFGASLTLSSRESGKRAPQLEGDRLILREDSEKPASEEERRKTVEAWYRKQLKAAAEPLMADWAARMKVRPSELRIRKMNTRWGSCNTGARRIWLSLELALFKPEILEFVLVHELAHLLEPSHNKRFKNIMDMYLPSWRLMDRHMKGVI